MKKVTGFFMLIIFFLQVINAQTVDNKWSVGLFGGKNEYTGDFGNAIGDFSKAFYGFGALQLNRYLSPSFDLGLNASYGDYGYYSSPTARFLGKKHDPALLLSYKLNNDVLFPASWKFSPSLIAGTGLAYYTGNRISVSGVDFIVPVGLGLKYQISPKFAVQYTGTYQFTFNDDRDFAVADKNDGYAKHSIGIVLSFGAPCDGDNDGVKDKFDKCLNSPAGSVVNAEGCPADKDGDGVMDNVDDCPDVAGLSNLAGCPDRDNDGIADKNDNCPDVAGISKFAGCPDTDNDGIQDSEDKCPKVAGIAKFMGCPDTDNDGIVDSEDRCPDVAGPADLKGCPDRDGDKVADIDDKCPDVPGFVINKGCPEVKAEVKKIFAQALTGIQFETGKDVIRPTSFPILNNVVTVMKDNPEYLLEINGHTDNVGDDAANLDLSQRRANAVKKYLTDKGIDAARMTAKGYGETMPVEDNATPAGRAKNRRVEFKVNF